MGEEEGGLPTKQKGLTTKIQQTSGIKLLKFFLKTGLVTQPDPVKTRPYLIHCIYSNKFFFGIVWNLNPKPLKIIGLQFK